jgi:hypothetical protein
MNYAIEIDGSLDYIINNHLKTIGFPLKIRYLSNTVPMNIGKIFLYNNSKESNNF